MVCCFGVVTDRDLSIDDSNTGTGHDLSIDDSDTGTGRDLSLREPQMILNAYGKIAEQQWYWLAEQYRYIVLHEFIVMPNHMHGIIEINRNAAGTGRDLSLRKIKSLSELMGAYKTTASKHIHLAGYVEFAWQRSFHDHIIRDEKSYERISNYIIDNPKTWDKDKFFNVGTGRDLSVNR
jgi:REP element-mobilizing transposase RayT